jgi:hypothetical protein
VQPSQRRIARCQEARAVVRPAGRQRSDRTLPTPVDTLLFARHGGRVLRHASAWRTWDGGNSTRFGRGVLSKYLQVEILTETRLQRLRLNQPESADSVVPAFRPKEHRWKFFVFVQLMGQRIQVRDEEDFHVMLK